MVEHGGCVSVAGVCAGAGVGWNDGRNRFAVLIKVDSNGLGSDQQNT